MELAKDTRDRIFAAADSLYEQAGRAAFPTVDAVRKVARVNMNDASAGMKEWRRAQTAQAAPVAVQVPEAVQQASSAALASLWKEAQELANESLRAAQAGWDAERLRDRLWREGYRWLLVNDGWFRFSELNGFVNRSYAVATRRTVDRFLATCCDPPAHEAEGVRVAKLRAPTTPAEGK